MPANLLLYLSISTRQANFRFSQQVTTISIGVGRLNRHGALSVVAAHQQFGCRVLCVSLLVVAVIVSLLQIPVYTRIQVN